jgi:hypothetical protein
MITPLASYKNNSIHMCRASQRFGEDYQEGRTANQPVVMGLLLVGTGGDKETAGGAREKILSV